MASADKLRLFFALWPDRRAQRALARLAAEVALHAQGRAPRPEGLHVTLAFLGAVPEARLPLALAAGERSAGTSAEFDLAFERIGGTAFGIAWLAPAVVPDAMRMLHEALAVELEAAGFPRERRMFRPHVTLARDCSRAAQRGGIEPIRWSVDRLVLVASTLESGGSRYRNVATWPLRGVH